MATITVDLLSELNKDQDNKSLVKKYIIKVTASQLSQYLKIEKDPSKIYPYRIKSDSIIKIHADIQRGVDIDGYYLQEKRKVEDIKNALLGKKNDNSKVFLGTLVWNVRNSDSNDMTIQTILPEDGTFVPKKTLTINTDSIFLTDSAHRHFAIVDANEEYHNDISKYTQYDENFEFPVEVYFLEENDEKKLFYELNAKQKKITTTRQKYIDNITPYGKLKDAILEHDISNLKYFYNNVELISNTHQNSIALMTMSVFVACIKEVFPKKDLNKLVVNPELQIEFSKYFCNFFYKLSEVIVVNVEIAGKNEDILPFENTYQNYLFPIEEEYNIKIEDTDDEEEIQTLEEEFNTKLINERERLLNRKKDILKIDYINHNITLKALSRLARQIKYMSNWEIVLTQLQNILLEPDRTTFQAHKEPWTTLLKNTDEPMSLSVNNHNVTAIYDFFIQKLDLIHNEKVFIERNNLNINVKFETSLPDKISKVLTFDKVKLTVNEGRSLFDNFSSNTITARSVTDKSITTPYQDSIERKSILFELVLNEELVEDIECTIEYPSFDNSKSKYIFKITKNEN